MNQEYSGTSQRNYLLISVLLYLRQIFRATYSGVFLASIQLFLYSPHASGSYLVLENLRHQALAKRLA